MTTMPAAALRSEARHAYNANLAGCPGHMLLTILSDKWVTLVVAALGERPRRHSELARTVAGATQKMLTQTLRSLERDGLVERTVTADVPPHVSYRLTPLGEELLPLQRMIKIWAEEHVDQILGARAKHDAS